MIYPEVIFDSEQIESAWMFIERLCGRTLHWEFDSIGWDIEVRITEKLFNEDF